MGTHYEARVTVRSIETPENLGLWLSSRRREILVAKLNFDANTIDEVIDKVGRHLAVARGTGGVVAKPDTDDSTLSDPTPRGTDEPEIVLTADQARAYGASSGLLQVINATHQAVSE